MEVGKLQRASGMSETGQDCCAPMAQALFRPRHFARQLVQIGTTAVPQLLAFEQIPDPFLRVEVRCIARQALQMHPLGRAARQEVLDRLPAVNWCPVPDHQELARHFAQEESQEESQEADNILPMIAVLLHLKHQRALRGNRPDHGKMVMGQRHLEDWGVSYRGLGANRHRQQIEARLVYKDDGASFLISLFLSVGQRSVFQRVIAASSRWLARTTGFCTLCPHARNNRLQWAR